MSSDTKDEKTNPLYEGFRADKLEVKLAQTNADIDAAQALRYQIFYEEMNAQASPEMAAKKRDFDDFDPYCDHLLVIDHSNGEGVIVGTYRLIRRVIADKVGQFYSSREYDISCLLEYPGEILELGRSCVKEPYRTRPVLNLLWQGIAAYVSYHNIKLLFGCASFPGNDVNAINKELSYLYHYHLAPPALRTKALKKHHTEMNLMAADQFNPKKVFSQLPPLLKGYLRVGAYIGDGAYIDTQWNSIDVCIIFEMDMITERYSRYYEKANNQIKKT